VKARIYSNENLPKRVVDQLRLLGYDVLTSHEAGRANQQIPDDQVLQFAIEQGRAVLTLNRLDFFRLHRATNGHHAGIIACTRDDADPQALARRIHLAIEGAGDLSGKVIRVVRPSVSDGAQ
jgi:predicted nuclease of predicted toxin-antitoxin system